MLADPASFGAPHRARKATPMASPAVDFARNNQPRFLAELKTLLRIPSIITLAEQKGDVQKAAEFVAAELRRIGMDKRRSHSDQGTSYALCRLAARAWQANRFDVCTL
jgi:acetylornithine deacetylase/succinyl-diaminopimelate desuccinylase-like protein